MTIIVRDKGINIGGQWYAPWSIITGLDPDKEAAAVAGGNALAAAGPVDGDGNSGAGLRVLALGTSITNKWGDTGADSFNRSTQGDSYLAWMCAALSARVGNVINKGVSGNNTSEMLARYVSDVAANYALFDTLIFEPGPNDYTTPLTAETVKSNITFIVSQANNAGKLVLLLTPTPSGSWSIAQRAVAQEVRQWILLTYRTNSSVRVVDVAPMWADPLTGLPLSVMYTPTSIEAISVHPSISGAQVMGRALSAAMPATFATRYAPLGQRDHFELLPNPRLQGNNASGARNFYAGAGVTVTGGPDSAAIGITAGGFSSVGIAPVVGDGSKIESIANGTRITVGAASADRSTIIFRVGSGEPAIGGTQYGRWDQAWVASTTQIFGDHRTLIAATAGILTCIVGGTTAASAPVPPTAYGMTVVDGGVTWLWQRLPAVGDVLVPEIEYEIEAQTGGVAIFGEAGLYRTAQGDYSETWGNAGQLKFDTGVSGPGGLPGVWMPRRGVLYGLPVTLRNPGVAIRHVFNSVYLVFAAGATATVRIDRASLRRISP